MLCLFLGSLPRKKIYSCSEESAKQTKGDQKNGEEIPRRNRLPKPNNGSFIKIKEGGGNSGGLLIEKVVFLRCEKGKKRPNG